MSLLLSTFLYSINKIVVRDYQFSILPLNPDAVCIRDTRSKSFSHSLPRSSAEDQRFLFDSFPPFSLLDPLIPSRLPPPVKRKREAGGALDTSTMSARNIAGHHTGVRFAMIPRVINNVCFNVNLRLGSNLISTEATRSNADGDWRSARNRPLRNAEANVGERRKRRVVLKGRRRRRGREGRRNSSEVARKRRKKTNKKGRSALFAAARS